MVSLPTSESPSDSLWPGSSQLGKIKTPSLPSKKSSDLKEFLHPVDTTPEFHDPYSELNLYLSQKIKEEFKELGLIKKWSLYLQEKLIEKIAPEFQRKFPHCRLGTSALKKTWEKIAYFSEQLQSEKEAITSEGKLNLNYLIKKNLKHYFQLKTTSGLHTHHFAHQLAMKISEYLATIDGIRPMLNHLTKMIWAAQKHLLAGKTAEETFSPYDEFDKFDKLIVKIMLEITGKNPQISQKELEIQVKGAIQELSNLIPSDRITANISSLLAEKLYPSSSFHTLYFAEQKAAIQNFIERHISLYKTSTFTPQLTDFVRRIIALYTLASQLPKDLRVEEFETAILYLHRLETLNFDSKILNSDSSMESEANLNKVSEADGGIYTNNLKNREFDKEAPRIFCSEQVTIAERQGASESKKYEAQPMQSKPNSSGCLCIGQRLPLHQLVYAFISAELLLTDKDLKTIWSIYVEAKGLPPLPQDLLEMVIWKILSEKEGLLEKLPYRTGQRIDEEIAHILIDNPHQNFCSVVERTAQFFCNAKGIALSQKWSDIEQKITFWTLQGDLLCRWIRLDAENNTLLKLISEISIQGSHTISISEITQTYLKNHPNMAAYTPQVMARISILYKYAWYAIFASPEESSLDRFIKWHALFLSHLDESQALTQLEEICKKTLPLIPFDRAHAQKILSKEKGVVEGVAREA